jgi:hypothetical protein
MEVRVFCQERLPEEMEGFVPQISKNQVPMQGGEASAHKLFDSVSTLLEDDPLLREEVDSTYPQQQGIARGCSATGGKTSGEIDTR